jgi:hypothetical protein
MSRDRPFHQDQAERADQDRFARAGFTGSHSSPPELDGEGLHQGQVPYAQRR